MSALSAFRTNPASLHKNQRFLTHQGCVPQPKPMSAVSARKSLLFPSLPEQWNFCCSWLDHNTQHLLISLCTLLERVVFLKADNILSVVCCRPNSKTGNPFNEFSIVDKTWVLDSIHADWRKLLLLLAGDIEENPGPKQKESCGSCGDSVGFSSIQCSGSCGKWFHRRCSNLTVEGLRKINTNHNWQCNACINVSNAEIQTADKTTSLSDLTSNLLPDVNSLHLNTSITLHDPIADTIDSIVARFCATIATATTMSDGWSKTTASASTTTTTTDVLPIPTNAPLPNVLVALTTTTTTTSLTPAPTTTTSEAMSGSAFYEPTPDELLRTALSRQDLANSTPSQPMLGRGNVGQETLYRVYDVEGDGWCGLYAYNAAAQFMGLPPAAATYTANTTPMAMVSHAGMMEVTELGGAVLCLCQHGDIPRAGVFCFPGHFLALVRADFAPSETLTIRSNQGQPFTLGRAAGWFKVSPERSNIMEPPLSTTTVVPSVSVASVLSVTSRPSTSLTHEAPQRTLDELPAPQQPPPVANTSNEPVLTPLELKRLAARERKRKSRAYQSPAKRKQIASADRISHQHQNMNEHSINVHRQRNRHVSMEDASVIAHRERNRHSSMEEMSVTAHRERNRHSSMEETSIDEHRQRNRHCSMPETSIAAHRERNRHANMNDEEIDAHVDRANRNRTNPPRLLCARMPYVENEVPVHDLGPMTVVCRHCGAFHWLAERVSGPADNPNFSSCCKQGSVQLLPRLPSPEPLNSLLSNTNREGVTFRQNIRAYNSVLSFTSIGANIDPELANGRDGVFTYRLHGQLVHKIGSLLPQEGEVPRFSQLYVYDNENETNNRLHHVSNLNPVILNELQAMMHENNPYVHAYKRAVEIINQNPPRNVQLIIRTNVGNTDQRRYNAPQASEVAAILPASDNSVARRDIVVTTRGGYLQRIYETHAAYDPLHYVLLFPRGESGWSYGMLRHTPHLTRPMSLSLMDFFSYRLFTRENDFYIHLAGRLFHQYIVDCWARIEQNRLNWQLENQNVMRAEFYNNVQDAVFQGEDHAANIGRRVILSSTFQNSPRQMYANYQDAMAIVGQLGKPDLFITITCNPKWPEITNALLPGQRANDRPDLCTRVFNLKLRALMNDLVVERILGTVIGRVYVVEAQKRGLLHAHILLIYADEHKPRTPDDYDSIVRAEIPDPDLEPDLYKIVTSCMVHGPCGRGFPRTACLDENGACKKRYPREFNEHSSDDGSGYPLYRRRNNGQTVNVGRNNQYQVDNRWIVPYNPWLSRKYQCHINVEICSSITAVKYLYKYVYKGHDRVIIQQVDANAATHDPPPAINEVHNYLDARYVSASESTHRGLGYIVHQIYPPVLRLCIHLPNHQQVFFNSQRNIQEVVAAGPQETMLTQFFSANVQFPEATTLLYYEMPTKFTWNKTRKRWKLRHNPDGTAAIGRMYTVQPSEGERFYLRLLLCHIRGPTSFEQLRTINGRLMDTFREGAIEMGLFADDSEWTAVIREASLIKTGAQLRALFAMILQFGPPAQPELLFEEFKNSLSEDIARRQPNSSPTLVYNEVLIDLNRRLNAYGRSLNNFPDMPLPQQVPRAERHELREQRLLAPAPDENLAPHIGLLNPEQLTAFNTIKSAVENNSNSIYFLDAPAGTGKTFTINILLDVIRQNGYIALAVATSGIAALLLHGGRTVHSRLKIPIENLSESSICSISAQSGLADLIRHTSTIVWDEATMANKYHVDCVDRSLRDICHNENPFGGKVVVFSGDFRQVLPVVRHGERAKIVSLTIKRWSLWHSVVTLRLTVNMRINSVLDADPHQQQSFSEYLIRVGNGMEPIVPHTPFDDIIQLPPQQCIADIDEFISFVFPSFENGDNRFSAILTPKNNYVTAINKRVLAKFPGELITYYSADSVADSEQGAEFPIEFLNSLTPSGMPNHVLELKLDAPVILLRNLNPSEGLCNGVRLICKVFQPHVIDCEIVSGTAVGKRVFIPRITLSPSDSGLPFVLQRRQFPLSLCFCMTINKSQSQTMDTMGLYLPQPVFTHGQLYVALSRVSSSNRIAFCLENAPGGDNQTRNVVYKEVLQ